MSDLRIFSYLPNPRIWKATIAARLCGVDVEVRGTAPRELQSWLWDFDAHPLSSSELETSADLKTGKVGFNGKLHKTASFMEAHPFGTVPAAFSPDGRTGIFESNSIMRAVARLGQSRFPLYGRDEYEASRIDSFLDASLVFARDSQIYLLALGSGAITPEIHSRAREGFAVYLGGINQALSSGRQALVGNDITIADICFVAELALFFNEKPRAMELEKKGLAPIVHAGLGGEFPHAMSHFSRLSKHPAFAPDVEPYLAKIELASNRAEQRSSSN
ncbi:MAG: glutathione S-transferase family protein [Candidatus Binataceae bacterium]